jgi:hypothetical protein
MALQNAAEAIDNIIPDLRRLLFQGKRDFARLPSTNFYPTVTLFTRSTQSLN